MIVFTLIWILVGSFLAATYMAVTGASWGMIALAYVAGGWAGLALGGLVLVLACRLLPGRADKPQVLSGDGDIPAP